MTDHGEAQCLTMDLRDGREVVLIWTPRGADRRIIFMRFANEREVARYTGRPDDASDLTDEDFRRGTWKIGDKLVSQEVAQAEIAKLKQSTRQPPPTLNQTDA